MENKVYTINSWHIDSDFGGIIINAEIRGKEFELGAQLDNDDTEYYVGDSCWAFINGRAIDDGSAKITEIDIDENSSYWIFWAIVNKCIDDLNSWKRN